MYDVYSSRHDNLKIRSKKFALDVIRLVERLPKSLAAQTIGKQLIRSGTSVAANYRAACRARSTADFISKMGIVEEETDESAFWLEVLSESGIINPASISDLMDEANQLTAIWVSSINTARGRKR